MSEKQLMVKQQDQILSIMPENKQLDTCVYSQNENISNNKVKVANSFKFTQNMKDKIPQLKELMTLIPQNSSVVGDDQNLEEIRSIYKQYANTASLIDEQYNKLHSIVGQYQTISYNIASVTQGIKKQVSTRIEYGKLIDSQTILKGFQLQLGDIDQQNKTIKKEYQQIKQNIQGLNITKLKNDVLKIVNKISQNLFSGKELEDYEEKQKIINNLQLEITSLQSEIDIIESDIEYFDVQIKQLNETKNSLRNDLTKQNKNNKQQIQELDKLKLEKTEQGSKMIDWIDEQIAKCNSEKKEQIKIFINQKNEIMQASQKANISIQDSIQNSSLGSQSSSYIITLDESGSMKGDTFNQCIEAIRQLVKKLKQEDEFCLIQFDDEARITINKKQVKEVDIKDIGKKFSGGGTDFDQAFNTVKEVIPLCQSSNKINIVFFTDGQDNSDSCLNTLKLIKEEYSQYDMTLFCLGYGPDINASCLKKCLNTFNGNDLYKQVNGKLNLQTFYQVDSVKDIINTFNLLINSSLIQKEEIEMKMELQIKQNQDSEKVFDLQKNKILEIFDQKLKQLEDQKEKVIAGFKNCDVNARITEVKNIQKYHEENLLNQLKDTEKKLQETNQKINDKTTQMNDLKQKLQNTKQSIEDKKKIQKSDTFIDGFVAKNQERENLIKSYGFQNIHHYGKFIDIISVGESLGRDIENFIKSTESSTNSQYYFLQQVLESVNQISEEQGDEINDKNHFIQKYIQQYYLNGNLDQSGGNLNKLETNKIMEQFILKIDTSLSLQLKDNLNDQNFFAQIVPRFTSFVDILNLGNSLIKKKKAKGSNEENIVSIEQYTDIMFFQFYQLKQRVDDQASSEISKLEEKIEKLEQALEVEENQDKIERMQDQLTQLQQSLQNKKEKQEEKIERETTKQKLSLKKQYKRNYDIIFRIISNLHSNLKQIDYEINQMRIFSPIQSLSANINQMIELSETIQDL